MQNTSKYYFYLGNYLYWFRVYLLYVIVTAINILTMHHCH